MAEQCRQHVMRLGQGSARVTVKPSIFGSATAQEDAPLLRELGPPCARLPFARVEEGSGKRRDTDSYDDDYLHLILWDDEDLEIVGAYRFMPTARQDVLEHGIELGRSFIQPALLGTPRPGLFMPRGICWWPFYRLWFPATHPLAASRQPYPASLPDVLAQFGGVDYVDDLTKLKSLLGNLGCGIPPLYKQYSELCEPGGVQFIDFGSDPAFNNCVDGLVLVDLCLPEGEPLSAVY
ncbi:hypothetical protein L1887_60438 [Cichorium endivia]|nr:hypothetical protein L1887_60438 [Cichorium endivia]